MRALLAMHAGRTDQAVALLLEAAGAYDDAGMCLEASACRHRHGQLIGGDEGAESTAAAESGLRARGITRPERWIATVMPAIEV